MYWHTETSTLTTPIIFELYVHRLIEMIWRIAILNSDEVDLRSIFTKRSWVTMMQCDFRTSTHSASTKFTKDANAVLYFAIMMTHSYSMSSTLSVFQDPAAPSELLYHVGSIVKQWWTPSVKWRTPDDKQIASRTTADDRQNSMANKLETGKEKNGRKRTASRITAVVVVMTGTKENMMLRQLRLFVCTRLYLLRFVYQSSIAQSSVHTSSSAFSRTSQHPNAKGLHPCGQCRTFKEKLWRLRHRQTIRVSDGFVGQEGREKLVRETLPFLSPTSHSKILTLEDTKDTKDSV